MKFLDVNQHLSELDEHIKVLKSYGDVFEEVEARITRVINMDGAFKGEGAKGVIYNHAHMQLPTIRSIRAFLISFSDTLEKMKANITEYEPASNGSVSEDFWKNQLPKAYDRYEETLEEREAAINQATAEVSHILHLGKLQTGDVYNSVDSARKHADTVLEGLYDLDQAGVELMAQVRTKMEELKATIRQVLDWTMTGGVRMTGVSIMEVGGYFANNATLHEKAPEVSVKLSTPDPLIQYANDFPLRFKYDTMRSIMKLLDLSNYQKWFSSMIQSLPLTSFFNVARASTVKTSNTGKVSQSRMEWEEPDTTGRKYVQIEVATGVRIWVWSSDGRTATPEDLRFTEEHDEWKRKYGVKKETDPTLEQVMMDNFKDHAERLRTGVNPETGEALTEVERMQSWSVVLSGPSTLASLAYWGNRWGNVKVNPGIVDKKPTSLGSVNPKQKSSQVHAVESKPKDNNPVSEKKGNHSSRSGVVDGKGNAILEADKFKLSQWKYRPSDEVYIQYKHVFDNPKYYDQTTGNIRWPINDGFEGVAKDATLRPGTRIDRYGFESGTFVSPEGISYEMRSLAPGTKSKPYHVYEVLKPIEGFEGKIAPWFDEVGGGVQYKLTKSIQELIDEGYLREVFD
ncbi:T7SS effector LXG polymorphic toxin [Halalkalibacterium halodurans]|uniref:LXG domain-containing protein n=1 Tax=Halalkalibacterium halodurans TaxID=86665 RepID=A0A0M0KNQ4_ALKHA|nr:T7SS effector LXG polymorphic toxin [Halalkalibacterium halodurans]TPE68209.1 DUF4237 domain-containing protein [Halalkalibacterium halodurans]